MLVSLLAFKGAILYMFILDSTISICTIETIKSYKLRCCPCSFQMTCLPFPFIIKSPHWMLVKHSYPLFFHLGIFALHEQGALWKMCFRQAKECHVALIHHRTLYQVKGCLYVISNATCVGPTIW